MKKIITISTIFASSAMLSFAATPSLPDSPITEIVSLSQKGGADSALKIMQIQEKENIDISRDTFLISQLALCEGAGDTLIDASKTGNEYALKALKMLRLDEAEDTLLVVVSESEGAVKKNAMDALGSCGSHKALSTFLLDIPKVNPSELADYVRVSTELYKTLDADTKAKYKEEIETMAKSADGKAKAALERIIVEEVPADNASARNKKKK